MPDARLESRLGGLPGRSSATETGTKWAAISAFWREYPHLMRKRALDALEAMSSARPLREDAPARAGESLGSARAHDSLLADLTDAQREAVITTEGPLLILAAAGSGKTRVITRRIAYLLAQGVPAWQILALTFTNKAAGEMRQRVEQLLGEDGGDAGAPRGLTISTFHALCARLLRRFAPLMEGRPGWSLRADYSIYDSDDQQSLMKRVISEAGLQTSNWPPRTILAGVSAAKNRLQGPSDFAEMAKQSGDFFARTTARLYESYEKALRQANAVDFDDLMLLTVRLLRDSEEARRQVQERWRYLMIDEYQDTNHAQFVLSTLLSVGAVAPDGRTLPPNICVVGDPDQSIYGWRGADISNILEFEAQYPGTKVIALGQNFRSTAPILAAAGALIRHNKRRKHKDLFTKRPGGAKPHVILCADEHHEADVVLGWLKGLIAAPSEGEPPPTWKDMAVFYRNNFLSRVVEDALRRAGIPYIVARGTAFYQREEVKDALAYLRLIANPADEVSLRRIINKPARKIGNSTIARIENFAAAERITLLEAMRQVERAPGLTTAAGSAVRRFLSLIDAWTGGGSFLGQGVPESLADLVGRVLAESGLEAHYKRTSEISPGDEEGSDKYANLRELVSSARDFEEEYDAAADPAQERVGADAAPPPLLAMLRAYLESVSLVADADTIDPAAGAVTLMTLHAAKGLEFGAVAIVGLEEGLLPGQRAMEAQDGVEEERRLCFVGITRAMRHLLITSAARRTSRGLIERTIPSRFLDELPKEQIEVVDRSEEFGEAHDELEASGWGRSAADRRPARRASNGSASSGGSTAARSTGKAPAEAPFPVGAKVRHPQFGVGTVASFQGRGVNLRAVIEFRDVGTKTLVLQYARLQQVE